MSILTTDEKLSAFKKAVKKAHGMVPGISPVEKIETGIAPLDIMLDGGIPIGRMVELYGSPGGGKSTLAMVIASQFQEIKPILYIDIEASFSKEWAQNNELDVSDDKLVVYSAGSEGSTDVLSAESVMDIIIKALESEAFSLIIVDSVAAMVDEEKIIAGVGKSSLGSVARLLSSTLPIVNQKTVKSKTTVLFVNQVRANISIGYGSKNTKSAGGRALEFYDDLKIELSKAEQMKKDTEIVGHLIRLRVEKSKVSIPRRTCKFPIIYEFGISPELALFESAVELGVIQRSGSYYKFGGITLQGRENFLDEIMRSRDVFYEIKDAIYSKYVYKTSNSNSNSEEENEDTEDTKEKGKQDEAEETAVADKQTKLANVK